MKKSTKKHIILFSTLCALLLMIPISNLYANSKFEYTFKLDGVKSYHIKEQEKFNIKNPQTTTILVVEKGRTVTIEAIDPTDANISWNSYPSFGYGGKDFNTLNVTESQTSEKKRIDQVTTGSITFEISEDLFKDTDGKVYSDKTLHIVATQKKMPNSDNAQDNTQDNAQNNSSQDNSPQGDHSQNNNTQGNHAQNDNIQNNHTQNDHTQNDHAQENKPSENVNLENNISEKSKQENQSEHSDASQNSSSLDESFSHSSGSGTISKVVRITNTTKSGEKVTGSQSETESKSSEPKTEVPSFQTQQSTKINWFEQAVLFMKEFEQMLGIDTLHFDPTQGASRAMVMSVIYKIAHSPAIDEKSIFHDVKGNEHFAKALIWGSNFKVIKGYTNGDFGSYDNVTREQLANMLYNYANLIQMEPVQPVDIKKFKDSSSISEYAVESVNWAISTNIMQGRDNHILDPKGKATKAEVAMMIMRFTELLK